MKTWVKLYTEITRDPEQGTLTWAQRGIWAGLLALAGEIDARDESDHETGATDTVANTAWRLRCELGEFTQAIAAFTERGMVEERDGVLYLPHYCERQRRAPSAAHDRVTERVQRHRASKAAQCNEDVTRAQQGVTPTESEAESDTESEAEAEAEAGSAAAAAPRAEPEVAAVVERWEGVVGREATPEDCHKLSDWLGEYGAERVSYAIGQAHIYGAPKLAYVWRVLSDGGGGPRASPGAATPGPPRRETAYDRSGKVLDAILGGGNGNGRDGSEGAEVVEGELAEPRDHAPKRAAIPARAG